MSELGGRYQVRGILGRGGMAEVRDGWDTRLSRAVAIKLLDPAADSATRRRFEDEARSAAALNHPNIVAVHDSGEDDGQPFIVMERLPGRSLADEIATGPMAQDRVRTMLTEVLSALAAAHSAGILHRDIKPANILIGHSGEAKLADFGIAKTDGPAHTQTGQVIGTMAYLSPQRIEGRPATVADDIYAVGVLAYEMLCGRRPFESDNPGATMRAILDARPVPIESLRPDLDPALATVIRTATAPDPGARYPDAAAMQAALLGSRPATKVLTAPAALGEPAHVRHSRRPVLIAAGAAVVIAAIIIAVTLLAPRRSPQPTPTPVTPTTVPTTLPTATFSSVEPTPEPQEGGPGKGRGHAKEPPGKAKKQH